MGAETAAVRGLRTAGAVRERCAMVAAHVRAGESAHFELDEDRLPEVAARVAALTRRDYPDLAIPPHSRWRHFVVQGTDRFEAIAGNVGIDAAERARVALDAVVVSVLLDAGAGADWRYTDGVTGAELRRSEGLAVASLDLFGAGTLSVTPGAPLRADAVGLESVDATTLARAFQVSSSNPLTGLEGRAALLRSLGACVRSRPDVFGESQPRPGNLFDYLESRHGELTDGFVLAALLELFAPIWPNGESFDGARLGDVWPHDAVRGVQAPGLVPFHKLSQWLCYSVIEALERAGLPVEDTGELTGLAEYRNGGLFVDTGVARPRNDADLGREHGPGDEIVVEWRALTIDLLERLRPLVADALAVPSLPMAMLLQGGTWSAGRALAFERRAGGGPPLKIRSDGTVF